MRPPPGSRQYGDTEVQIDTSRGPYGFALSGTTSDYDQMFLVRRFTGGSEAPPFDECSSFTDNSEAFAMPPREVLFGTTFT